MFIQVADKQETKVISNVGDLIREFHCIIGDHMDKLYLYSDDEEKANMKLHATKQAGDDVEKQPLICKDDLIMRDLFSWAILHNRIDMAKVFLAHIKHRICAPLIATDVLKNYYLRAGHGDLKDGYIKNTEYFEQYAIDCINQCEKNGANMACEIVLQQIDLFGHATCLQVGSFIFVPLSFHQINDYL